MKKIYEAPAMAVQRFMEENIVTGSGDGFKNRMSEHTNIDANSIDTHSSSEFRYGY